MRYYAVLFSGDISTIIRNIAIYERHRANFYVIPDPVSEANNTRVRPDIDVITNDEAGSFFIAVFLANGCVLANDEVFAISPLPIVAPRLISQPNFSRILMLSFSAAFF